jgi:hypothetical protein
LAGPNPNERQKLLKHLDDDLLNAICTCVHNISQGKMALTTQQIRRLGPYFGVMKKLWSKKKSNKEKQWLLQEQKGGFLPALLAPLLGIVASVISATV